MYKYCVGMSPPSASPATGSSKTMLRFSTTLLLTATFLLVNADFPTETVTTCEANSVHRLSCESGVINVETAQYGRADNATCSEGKAQQVTSDTSCPMVSVKASLSNRYETDVREQVETLKHELQGEAQQRKLLQQQHNELEIAQASSQDKYTAELQVEQLKNNLLQDKLNKISQGYESEVLTVRQQAESLQRELEKEVKAHADTVLRDLQVITNLKAEQNDLRHRLTEEINNLMQKTLEKEEYYERQLEELKSQLTAQVSLSLVLSTELKALKEAEITEEKPCEQESIATTSAPELLEVTKIPEEKAREQESIDIVSAPELLEVTKIPEEKACEQESIASAPALELDMTQVSEETHPAKPKKSSWKRVRHFLGLRKPQKWKK